jgi:hypothetical protein
MPSDEEVAMRRTAVGDDPGDRGDVGRTAGRRLAAFVIIGGVTVGSLAASLFDAPLVSILLLGLLLVCPLLMWAPFRRERASRRHPHPDRDGPARSSM